jgi:hypothetical protein
MKANTQDLVLSGGIGSHLWQLDGGMGMPRTSRGLGTDEVGETAEMEERPKGEEEAVVSLHCLCYASRTAGCPVLVLAPDIA